MARREIRDSEGRFYWQGLRPRINLGYINLPLFCLSSLAFACSSSESIGQCKTWYNVRNDTGVVIGH